MMTRRTRLTVMALVLLGFLLLLLWLLWMLWPRAQTVEVEETAGRDEVEEVVPIRPTISEQELEEEREVRSYASDVVALSKSFVTRYGSYSNEADFANLEDVLPLASTLFAAQLQNSIDTAVVTEGYYGVSTSIVTVKVEEKDEKAGTASVVVTTQREEAVGSPQNVSVRYQDIVLTLVQEADTWKVDSATWQ